MKFATTFSILFICFFKPIFSQSQVDDLVQDSAKLHIQYADYTGYIDDSSFTKLRPASLFLGKKAAIYIYQTKTPAEFERDMKENLVLVSGKRDEDAVWKLYSERYVVEKMVSVIFVKFYASPDFLRLKKYDEGDIWLSDTFRVNWKLVNEFKTVAGYPCQKATFTSTKGHVVNAWFTEEIPFSVGPLNVSGLPGAILEYYNTMNRRLLRATAISSKDIPEQKFRKWLAGPVVTKADEQEIYQNGLKKWEQIKRMLDRPNN